MSVPAESARGKLTLAVAPKMVDGVVRYTSEGGDIGIVKNGDVYHIYDYNSGTVSKALTRGETNAALRKYQGEVVKAQNKAHEHIYDHLPDMRDKIIEKNPARCEELCSLLPEATIVNADGTDNNVLIEEGLPYAESLVSLINIDEENSGRCDQDEK